jgi:hypothetical protein
MEGRMMAKIDHLALWIFFHLGWLGSVWLAKTPHSWAALLFPAVLFGFLSRRGKLTPREFKAAAAVALAGIAFDSILLSLNLVTLDGQTGFLIPLWLVSIWLLFSCSMIKIGSDWKLPVWLTAGLGFVLGPLSYKSGEMFEVLSLVTPLTFWIYAVFWGLAFPTVIGLSKKVA